MYKAFVKYLQKKKLNLIEFKFKGKKKCFKFHWKLSDLKKVSALLDSNCLSFNHCV